MVQDDGNESEKTHNKSPAAAIMMISVIDQGYYRY
jgi:hypothetical protein